MTVPPACGIDFGTSNSAVAITGGTKGPRLLALEDGKTTVPSAIFFPARAAPLFGRAAIESYMQGEEGRLMRGLKKILGTPLIDDSTQIGKRFIPFTDILGLFMARLKSGADRAAGQEIRNVVMGRPVHFHDSDAAADSAAQDTLAGIMRGTGFSHVEFLFEPIAAAFAHERHCDGEKLALVVDIGGGTSDFSVIRLSSSRAANTDRARDILATSGVRIGGTTFDAKLSLHDFMPALGLGGEYRDTFDKTKYHPIPTGVYFQLSDWALANFAQTAKAIAHTKDIAKRAREPERLERLLTLQQNHLGHALLACVEKAKIMLSADEDVRADFKEIGLSVPVSRAGFDKIVEADIARVFDAMDACLAGAGVSPQKIDMVILTGGGAELPLIQNRIQKIFPHAALSQQNKLDSVGLGLAHHAARIFS